MKRALNVSAVYLGLLEALGANIDRRRHDALVFKKNAGKYVGNFNYRLLPQLTRRADLALGAGLGLTQTQIMEILGYVQRVLSINDQAGERSIPADLRAKYVKAGTGRDDVGTGFDEIDRVLAAHYGFTAEELDFIVNYDIKYRMGRDGDAGDA